jgi:xylan 1,4-beta-xylosidase
MRQPFGFVRIGALSAADVRSARTALTLYAVEPRSTVTVALNAAGLRSGDVAGLALLNAPFAGLGGIGAEHGTVGVTLARFDERGATTARVRLPGLRVWLRAECDFVTNKVAFRYSTDGRRYVAVGESHAMARPPDAAHTIRCSLFACSTAAGTDGGHAEFHSFVVATEYPAKPARRSRPRGPAAGPGVRRQPGPSSPAARVRDQR